MSSHLPSVVVPRAGGFDAQKFKEGIGYEPGLPFLSRGVAEVAKASTKPMADVAHRWCQLLLAFGPESRDCPGTLCLETTT